MARPGLKTVRGRLTALAAAVVAVAMVVGSVVLLSVYLNQLVGDLDQALTQQAEDRARLLDAGADPADLVGVQQDEALVWIGTSDGEQVAVSSVVAPLENPIPDTLGQAQTTDLLVLETKPDEVEREVMEARLAAAATEDATLVVVAGSDLEMTSGAVADLTILFAVGIPFVVMLVAGLTWFTTGKALRPVEDIRSRAAAISGTTLTDRVPVPAGGDEINQLAVTMNEMLERIESHDNSLRQFTADASHELKSPVANLRALVETADLDDDRWPSLRQHLIGESDRLRDLVENLLFLAAHDAGRPRASTVDVALDELLFVEAELLASTGTVTVDLSGVEPVAVSGVERELFRLVRNLVDNAARHATSRVSLAVTRDPRNSPDPLDTAVPARYAAVPPYAAAVVLTIGDDGPGIAPEDRDRAFERFTRLDDARARGDGGAGLGLAIVKRIADGHGAEVTIGQSNLGGAEFQVVFPA